MTLQVLLSIILLNGSSCDSLILPLRNGNLEQASPKFTVIHEALDAVIYPTDQYQVGSCFHGEVMGIRQNEDGRFSVLIDSDSVSLTYIMDTVLVNKRERVYMFQVIGKLKIPTLGDKSNDSFPLVLIATKRNKIVNARNFLVYGND